MKHIAVMAAMVAVLLAQPAGAETGEAHASTPPSKVERPRDFKLSNAAKSIDELVARLLDALAKNDAQALHGLRVTEEEYRTFVIPGSAKPGQPPQSFSERDSKFTWDLLNTKSVYAGQALLRGHGGKRYTAKKVEFAEGHKQYLWFDAYDTAVLTVEDKNGEEGELVLGSIAHIDGQYKFVSLLGDR